MLSDPCNRDEPYRLLIPLEYIVINPTGDNHPGHLPKFNGQNLPVLLVCIKKSLKSLIVSEWQKSPIAKGGKETEEHSGPNFPVENKPEVTAIENGRRMSRLDYIGRALISLLHAFYIVNIFDNLRTGPTLNSIGWI